MLQTACVRAVLALTSLPTAFPCLSRGQIENGKGAMPAWCDGRRRGAIAALLRAKARLAARGGARDADAEHSGC